MKHNDYSALSDTKRGQTQEPVRRAPQRKKGGLLSKMFLGVVLLGTAYGSHQAYNWYQDTKASWGTVDRSETPVNTRQVDAHQAFAAGLDTRFRITTQNGQQIGSTTIYTQLQNLANALGGDAVTQYEGFRRMMGLQWDGIQRQPSKTSPGQRAQTISDLEPAVIGNQVRAQYALINTLITDFKRSANYDSVIGSHGEVQTFFAQFQNDYRNFHGLPVSGTILSFTSNPNTAPLAAYVPPETGNANHPANVFMAVAEAYDGNSSRIVSGAARILHGHLTNPAATEDMLLENACKATRDAGNIYRTMTNGGRTRFDQAVAQVQERLQSQYPDIKVQEIVEKMYTDLEAAAVRLGAQPSVQAKGIICTQM